MNSLFFKYAIEVEKARSISAAAENLYMAQPNLSKAIREIEDILGFPVFSRTSKGVVPTEQGREFLVIARNIVSQLEKIDSIVASGDKVSHRQTFKICIPRASYISDAFMRFYTSLDLQYCNDINVKETNSMQTISSITSGVYSLGIIRYRPENEKYFIDYLNEKKLAYEAIWEYDYLLMFSKEHCLASKETITENMLDAFPKVMHSDNNVPYISRKNSSGIFTSAGRISLYERANQFELLSRSQKAYIWVSPVPQIMSDRFDLVQRRCSDSNRRFKDVLIYPKGYSFTKIDKMFVDKLYQSKNDVAFHNYY